MRNRVIVRTHGIGAALALVGLTLLLLAGCAGSPSSEPATPEATVITAETPTPSVTPSPTESAPTAEGTPAALGYPAPATPADPYPAMTAAAADALSPDAYPYP
ncbi:MAG: hypothetical protein ACYC4R_11165 [Anaerolineae bacterium]